MTTIYGDDNANILVGTPENDEINAAGGDDVLFGHDGTDTLNGGAGNDLIIGGTGYNIARGGAGNDFIIGTDEALPIDFLTSAFYDDATGAINAYMNGGLNEVGSYVLPLSGDNGVGSDVLVNVEQVVGSMFNDRLYVSDNYEGKYSAYAGTNLLVSNKFFSVEGGDGDDQIIGNGYTRVDYQQADGAVTVDIAAGSASGSEGGATNVGTDTFSGVNAVRGSNFDDTLLGSDQATGESFAGEAGNDFIDGRGGDDLVEYRLSQSGIVADFSGGAIGEGTVHDGYGTIDTVINVENLFGSNHDDNITMDDGANWVVGRDGDDTIRTLGGDDIVHGGAGDDVIYGGAGNDQLYGQDGLNAFLGGAGDDLIVGGTSGDGDRAIYADATSGVTVNMAGAHGTAGSTVTGDESIGTDRLVNVESVRGSRFDDTYVADASFQGEFGAFNEFEGAEGNDTIQGNGATRIDYRNANGEVIVDLAQGTAQGTVGGATNVGVDTILGGVNAVNGSNYGDTLIGSDADGESFRGGAGNDTIDGGAGVDMADYYSSTSGIVANLSKGAGTVEDGLGGTDTLTNIEDIRGSFHDDVIKMGRGASTVYGLDGNDDIAGGRGKDVLYGGDGNDLLKGNRGQDELYGGDGNDILKGGKGDDTLMGGDGFDQYVGGRGNDTFIGGNSGYRLGADQADYSNANVGIDVYMVNGVGSMESRVIGRTEGTDAVDNVGTDTLDSIEMVRGTDFDDTYNASVTFQGEFGSFNEFEGGDGNDTINGNGNTRVSYLNADGGVEVDLAAGTGQGAVDGATNVGVDTFSGVNSIRGSAHDDVLSGTDNAARETFRGEAGNDIIDGRGGIDRTDYNTSSGSVFVNLSEGELAGLASGTATDGEGGVDTLINIEEVRGSRFDDTIIMNEGNNVAEGFKGDDLISMRGGHDYAHGGTGNDEIYGGDGYDTLIGGAGDDSVRGGEGNDTFVSGFIAVDSPDATDDGDDVYLGNEGVDTADYSGATTAISVDLASSSVGIAHGAQIGTDLLVDVENIITGSGNDTIIGSAANNRIEGGAGEDILTGGGEGVDFDVFVFNANDGQDIVTDFTDGMDLLDLSGISLTFEDINIYSINDAADTLVDVGAANTQIILTGVSSDLIGQDDFLF